MFLSDSNMSDTRAAAASQFVTLTVVSIVFLLFSVVWGFVDARQVDGAAVWMKPLKFAISFAVLFGTIALILPRLSPSVREGWPLRAIGWVMAAAFLSEMAYMTYQAALGEASHFNMGTPFHLFMYQVVMGGGAVALVLSVALIGWIVQRDSDADLGRGLRAGIFLGFGMTFVLTMVTAGYLSMNNGHFVGLHPEGAAVLPLFGWSGVTGDLRPAHFAALHAMQALPLLGLWLDRRGGRTSVRAVRIGAALYGGLTLAVFAQALMGLPLIRLG
jgi:hypothetical protein